MRVEVVCYIFFASTKFTYLNARDRMSAIAISFPAILVGVRDNAFLSRCQSASNRSILASGIDVGVIPLYFHATSDLLSQKLPMCLNFRSSTTYSSTSHPRTNPASSSSFIVNIPFRFV